VRYPVTPAEEELADLFMGEDQGTLLYMMGSDNDRLRHGNDAFDLVLDKFAQHPMANYARMTTGINAGRRFKRLAPSDMKTVQVREPKAEESTRLLATVADSGVLDPVSTRMVLYDLSCVQRDAGDDAGAGRTLTQLSALGIRIA